MDGGSAFTVPWLFKRPCDMAPAQYGQYLETSMHMAGAIMRARYAFGQMMEAWGGAR